MNQPVPLSLLLFQFFMQNVFIVAAIYALKIKIGPFLPALLALVMFIGMQVTVVIRIAIRVEQLNSRANEQPATPPERITQP